MTEYGIAILAAIAYLDTADSNERIYFLDTLNSNYCSMCGDKIRFKIDLRPFCGCLA